MVIGPADVPGLGLAVEVHVEGILLGEVRFPTGAQTECSVQLMLRGTMRIPIDPATGDPLPPTTTPWEADFTVDGELGCSCGPDVTTCATPVP